MHSTELQLLIDCSFSGSRGTDANALPYIKEEFDSASEFEGAVAEKFSSVRVFLTNPSRWLPGVKALGSWIKQYLREANVVRKELNFPAHSRVLKLTLMALIGTAVMMGLVSLIDYVCFKLLAEPYLKRLSTLKVG